MIPLKLMSVRTRSVIVPLRRPVIADIGRFDQWPVVLVDVELSGSITGSSYIAPYRATAMPSIRAEIQDLADALKGMPAAPFDLFETAAKRLNVVGTTGISLIAIAALDMAIWDGLAKDAGVPLAVLLGGTLAPVRAYNSNGLWRHDPSTLASEARELREEGGFSAMKLRLGNVHLKDDLGAIDRTGIEHFVPRLEERDCGAHCLDDACGVESQNPQFTGSGRNLGPHVIAPGRSAHHRRWQVSML